MNDDLVPLICIDSMRTKKSRKHWVAVTVTSWTLFWVTSHFAQAVTTIFFDPSQTTNLVSDGVTSQTISTEGYLFTLTRDKLFTGGIGLTNPIGRRLRVQWPAGLEAQAVTTGPILSKARIDLRREDRQPFAIESFTAQLLANTAGAGGAIEIMPQLNGEDGVPDPYAYDATGIAGNRFTYATPELSGFDAYTMTLYVDFALTSLTVVDASLPPPTLELVRLDEATLELSWPTSAVGYALEQTSALPAPTWNPVTNQVVVQGAMLSVRVEIPKIASFYRLRN